MNSIAPGAAAVEELNTRYGTQIPGTHEIVKWPYYDSQVYPMAGSTRLQFFQTVGTDLDQSNVEQAAAFPSPKKYFLRGLGLFLVGAAFPSATTAAANTLSARVNDNHEVFTSGHLELLIGNKQYLFGAPLGLFPSPVVFSGYAATDSKQAMAADLTNTIANQNNGAAHRDTFLLDPPLLIDSQINFTVVTAWTTAVAITAATRLFTYFLGQMIRPAQ